jgi:hypothetical protein
VRQGRAIDLAATEESLHDSRLGKDMPVMFEERSGSYWLISAPNDVGYLVPNRSRFRFNENNLDSVHICFHFNQAEAGEVVDLDLYRIDLSAFRVISPALLTRCAQDNRWQLQRRGRIQFEPKHYAE